MRVLFAKPDIFVRINTVAAAAIGGLGCAGASILFLTGRASVCEMLPVYSVSCALLAALPWGLRRTRLDQRGRARRLALELIALAVILAALAVWWLSHPESC